MTKSADFGEIPIDRYRTHDRPLLDNAKAFFGKLAWKLRINASWFSPVQDRDLLGS